MLTQTTTASLVQVLQSVSDDAARLLLVKHLGVNPTVFSSGHLLYLVGQAVPDQIAGLLVELIGGKTRIRADAPTKHVYDGRLEDLRTRLRADGFEVVDASLVRLLPAAEPSAAISDYLEDALATGDLDGDGEIRRLLRESRADVTSTPPRFNDSTTKARIALETVARRSAAKIATNRDKVSPSDNWGAALAFLRSEAIIAPTEEEALAKVYTLISAGAHVPKGLTDEQWALLARTFAVSGTYFVLRQYSAA